MLVYEDGSTSGTIGGGEMEARVCREALDALAKGKPRHLAYSLVDPNAGDPGVCGGDVAIYVEPYLPPLTVYVMGGGHVGAAVADLGAWLGYRVVVWDDRPDVHDGPTTEQIERLVGPIDAALEQTPIDAFTYVVLVTRNPGIDSEILPRVLETPARAIGVMGSARRWKATRANLTAAGVPHDALERVISPVGLEIGAETPGEIAVSILSEIIGLHRAADSEPVN